MQSEQTSKLKDELSGPFRVMQEAARRIAKIAVESKLPLVEGESFLSSALPADQESLELTINISAEEYVASFKPELMDAVFSWCNGAKFSEICKVSRESFPLSQSHEFSSIFPAPADDRCFRRITDPSVPTTTRTDSTNVHGYALTLVSVRLNVQGWELTTTTRPVDVQPRKRSDPKNWKRSSTIRSSASNDNPRLRSPRRCTCKDLLLRVIVEDAAPGKTRFFLILYFVHI